MSRTVKNYNVSELREFSTRESLFDWLPSIGSGYSDTFTLAGVNPSIGGSSKGEINILTDFGPPNPENDINLKRFMLVLYCLRHLPYNFEYVVESLNYAGSNVLLLKSFESYLKILQTGNGSMPYSRSLTADIVRTYRGSAAKDSLDKLDNETSIQSLINYSRTSKDYAENVTGVLGKVTYDSIIKHTLYSLLLSNNLIKDYSSSSSESWSEKAVLLGREQFDLYTDVSGGQFKRAFPVICVYTKTTSGKKLEDIIDNSNNLVKSKFFRSPIGSQQLVSIINVGNEKNFLEYPIRDTGDSAYCVLYDLVKVLVLPPITDSVYTLDLLKIGLSVLSKKNNLKFKNALEFKAFYEKISEYLSSSYAEQLEDLDYEICYQNKHSEECEYLLGKEKKSFKAKFSGKLKVELTNLLKSLRDSYSAIISAFNSQIQAGNNQNFQFESYPAGLEVPLNLHFDNFYNLLAITSINLSPSVSSKKTPEDVPFNLEEYKTVFKHGELVEKFFQDANLPSYAAGEYKFAPSIAKGEDIVLITDAFLKQLYENLDNQGNGIVFENDDNELQDKVLKFPSFRLLDLIEERTGFTFKKSDYFYISSGNIYLRNEVVRKLSLSELIFSFVGAREPKVKFQTLSRILFSTEKTPATINDFVNDIYYPKLKEVVAAEIQNVKEPATPSKLQKENNNYLINNIITSELACYEDISNSFDSALNAETPQDKVYYAAQALANIGLPILLSYASQLIANKLAEMSNSPGDPGLISCLLADSSNLKKMILGFADLASSENPEDYLLQYAAQLPELPIIPYFPVFDLEKEIKRRIVEYVIDQIISLLKRSLNVAIQPVIDMCNSDSYLTSFLDAALPDEDSLSKKVGTPTPSGLPTRGSSTVYIPAITIDINSLIDQTGRETKENVYEAFRTTFFVTSEEYSNQEISDFFDYLSEKIDAGEFLSLIKETSSPQTRSLVLGYIQNYDNAKFKSIIADEQTVAFLFVLISQFVDYTIVMELISKSLKDFVPSVCIDVNSRFEEFSSKYPVEIIDAQANELENSLADACSLKSPLKIDILSGGPSLLTNGLKKAMNSAITAVYSTSIPIPQKLTKEIVSEIYEIRFTSRASSFKKKSEFVLKEMFGIGMTLTNTEARKLQYKNGESFWVPSTSDRFYKDILNFSTTSDEEKESLPLPYQRLSKLGNDKLLEFVSAYIWAGKSLGESTLPPGNYSPPNYSGYEGKIKDNQISNNSFVSPLFNTSLFEVPYSKYTKKIIGLWEAVIDKPIKEYVNEGQFDVANLFYGVDANSYYYLAMNARYTKTFINTLLDGGGVSEQEDLIYIAENLKVLQNTPSLKEYFNFALKLYEKYIEIEEELTSGESVGFTELISSWHELPTSYLTSVEFKKEKNYKEFDNKISNAGNIGLKTEESSLSGYIRKYETIRGTKTQIYLPAVPGELTDDMVVSFEGN
jgi:hypothetical protein